MFCVAQSLPIMYLSFRLSFVLVLLVLGGCQSMGAVGGSPMASCDDPAFADMRARPASEVDAPAQPVGGLDAVQQRVRVPNEGGRIATPEGRFAVVRAVVDTIGVVRCSDVLVAETEAKGEAARRALHRSPFTPGRHAGAPVVSLIDVRLDVRGPGVRRVVRGDQLR